MESTGQTSNMRKSSNRCAYCYEYQTSFPGKKFFKFPANEEMCKKWVAACGRPYLMSKTVEQLNKGYKICSDHFQESDYATSKMCRLKSSAIPSFNVDNSASVVDIASMADSASEDTSDVFTCIRNKLSVKLNAEQQMKLPSDVCSTIYSAPSSSQNSNILDISEVESSLVSEVDRTRVEWRLIRQRCLTSVSQNRSVVTDKDTSALSEVPQLTSTPKRKRDESAGLQSPSKRRKVDAVEASFVQQMSPNVDTPKTSKIKKFRSKYYYVKRQLERGMPLDACLKTLQRVMPPVMYKFLHSQLKCYGKSAYGRRWTAEDKNLALQIFLTSPRAYSGLMKFFRFPTKRTLQKTLSGISIKPGFFSSVLKALTYMSSTMKDEDKLCTLMFDEMKIKEGLAYYSRYDQIIGYENCSDKQSPQLATHALVFMVRGICKKWKQSFGVFFSKKSASSEELKSLVIEAIRKVQECGLNPQAIICDMATSNQALFTYELAVTEDKPYFFVNKKKIFALFDPPHLLKCLRNNFSNYPTKFSTSKVADWDHIVKLFYFDASHTHRVVKKLTKEHVDVGSLKKMSVRRAAQVLSNSVAAALCFMTSLNGLPAAASHTAEFCSTVNDLFDSVNSREFMHNDNPLRSAVTRNSIHLQKWQEYKSFIRSIKFDTTGKKKNINFPCLKGWQITLSAFLQLIPDLLNQIPFVLMNRFNQDALENYFSMVRRKGGNYDHPTALHFLHRSRHLLASNLMNFCADANCEADSDALLIPANLLQADEDEVNTSAELVIDESLLDVDDVMSKVDASAADDPFLSNPAAFVGGYVAKKFLKSHILPCEHCKNLLVTSKSLSQSSIFLNFKEFDSVKHGLHHPSTNLTSTIVKFGEVFSQVFQESSGKPNVAQTILRCIQEIDHTWLDCPEHGESSWVWITKFYTKMMLYNKVKFINAKIPNRKSATQKLNKL